MPKKVKRGQKFPKVSEALKGNKNGLGNSGGPGQKLKFDKKMVKLIYRLALLGSTDKEIATTLEVQDTTLHRWKREYPEIVTALKAGRDEADARVADSLYRRALGYKHKAVELKVVSLPDGGGSVVEKVDVVKHYPPDTKAASLWLRNRKSKFWKERDSDEEPSSQPVVWNETKTYDK